MKTLKKILAWFLGLFVLAVAGASMWFWFTPVGLNNYVNNFLCLFYSPSTSLHTQKVYSFTDLELACNICKCVR